MKMQICNPISRIKASITRARHTHTSQSHVTPIDHGEVLTILSSERRRWAIEFLADKPPDSEVSVSDLTEYVATRENDCEAEGLSSQQRNRVYVSLYQQHLVNLEPVIEYDEDRGLITPTEVPKKLWNAYRAFQHTLDG